MKKEIVVKNPMFNGKTSKTYFLEKASNLMYNLLIGKGDARSRLRENENMILFVLALNVPEEFTSEQKKILSSVTKKGALQIDDKIIVSAFSNSIARIQNSTASKIIQKLS